MPVIKTTQDMIFYARIGQNSAFPLLLIHGAGSSHLVWSAALRRFSGRRVLAIDLPGHGRSSKKGYDSVNAYTDSVLSLMKKLESDTFIPVGHSLGGAVTQMLAIEAPERIAGLVLIGTGAKLPVNPQLLDLFLQDRESAINRINEWQWSKDTPDSIKEKSLAAMQTVPGAIYHGDYLACNNFDLSSRLHEISAPTLVLAGEHDRMVKPAISEALAKGIPNAQFIQVKDAGHMLPLEQSELVAQYIQTWLEGQAL